jgi:hypothetical protein
MPPFNGSGTFDVYTPGNPVVTGTAISSTAFNATMTDIATGLSNTLTRDGQAPAIANIPMGNHKITGLANGTLATDAANLGQFAASTGSSLVGYLPAGTSAVATTVQTKLRESVSVKDFGAVGDGVTDDTAAIQLAITAASGKKLYFPSGTYNTTGNINLVSNILICGDGEGSKIVVTGVGTNNIFNGSNLTSVAFDRLWFYGNNQSNASGNGLAIYIDQSVGATSIGRDFYITNCRFDNFKGDYWVYFTNESTTYEMQNFYVCNSMFTSYSGNARNGASTAVPSSCVAIQGSTAGANATNINILNNSANCTYIKTFSILWQGCRRAVVSRNIINGAGTDVTISNDSGAYAFLCYDSSSLNVPRDILYDGNVINGVKSCGFYSAAAINVRFINNAINDQTDTVTATLPKGAIVLNGCSDFIISGNMINTCASGGIYWVPDSASSHTSKIVISNNTIEACSGIPIWLVVARSAASDVSIVGNMLVDNTNARSISVQTLTTGSLTRLNILNNNIYSSTAGVRGIDFFTGDTTYNLYDCFITGNSITTTYGGIDVGNFPNPIVISNNRLTGPFSYAGIVVPGAADVTITNNIVIGQISGGYAVRTHSAAQGVMFGNIFKDCATANIYTTSGNTLGVTAPWFTPTGYGEFVQNLAASELGAAASKYIIDGWRYTGTTTAITAGAFVVGNTYIIASIGTTDFTLVGATANTVGLRFKATGVGVGTGTANFATWYQVRTLTGN